VSFRVVVADRVADAGLERLREAPEIEVVLLAGRPVAELERALADAHALIVRSETRVTAALLSHAPHLLIVARAGVGVDNIDVPAATRRGIAVINAPGANTISAAEHTLALLLALARRVPWAAEAMRRGEWDRKRFEGTELRGKTLGLVGLGRIGGYVASLARAFGMVVLAHDPYLAPERAAELHVKVVGLEDLLRASDVVSLHLALTPQTQRLINSDRLQVMKPGAVLVNTARGELVDEMALVAAIENGRLAGAALDVFATEPLAADSPLRRLERVILTPHLAASTAEAQERVSTETCSAVREALLQGDLSGALNVPGIAGEALRRLAGVLELARRLGRLALALAEGPVTGIEVAYGGSDDAAPRPVLMAAVEGLLAGMGVEPVTLVNALLLAEERGIRHSRRSAAPEPGFKTTVTVALDTVQGPVRVAGAPVGDAQSRVIRVGDYRIDVAPEGWMLVIRNRDVPGVIGNVGTMLGRAGINIGSYHQARLTAPGQDALAAITVDQPLPEAVLDALARLPDVLRVRLAYLGPVAEP